MTTLHDELAWRAQVDAAMRADDGWLTLAGLFWLNPGVNTFGSGEDQDIVFPANSCPAHLGVFIRDENDNVSIELTNGESVTINGNTSSSSSTLQGDGDGKHKPDVIGYRDLSFFVIPRGHRVGIRLRDHNSAVRAAFTGRIWFDYDPAYRVEADFVAYEPGKTIPILTVLGDVDDTPSPGYVRFDIAGQSYTLDAVAAGKGLFFNFRDTTCGKETYGAGRFLMAGEPQNGKVIVDFNRAVSPPCAFTIYATCPIAPSQNHLPVAISAGEKYHGDH
jgi:uncharacterized protein (DUF1684 family)